MNAIVVEITIDPTGKLSVNVDDECMLCVDNAEFIHVDVIGDLNMIIDGFAVYEVAKPGGRTIAPRLVAVFAKRNEAVAFADEFIDAEYKTYRIEKKQIKI